MIDRTLERGLQRVQGEEPTAEFVDELRNHLAEIETTGAAARPGHEPVTVLGLRSRPTSDGRSRILVSAAAAILFAIGFGVTIRMVSRTDAEIGVSTATEAVQVGETWLQTIVDGDRESFLALHAVDLEVDDTLMGFSEDTGILTSARVSELYDDGFDALQAAVEIDGDVIQAEGCEATDDGQTRCSFTATMIGTNTYSYTVTAVLDVEDRLISAIEFSTTTEPADFRSLVEGFLESEATDEDRACMALGFNTIGCGVHESDFVTRYAAYYEAAASPPDN